MPKINAESELLIEVASFSKTYGSFSAVSNLSFAIKPGQILGLIGQNGAGKTTTLRTIAGILRPGSGRIFVCGHDVVKNPLAAKTALGYIPDDPRLFDALTIWEHLEFIASAYRINGFEPAAEKLLEEFELIEKRDTVTRGLSRGMRQKVAVMCACLPDPSVLLFDEPLTGLDPSGIRAIQKSIRDRASKGAAVVISSHLLNLVEDLCSHILVLQRGESRWFGPIDELLAQVRTTGVGDSLEEAFFGVTGEHSVTGPTK